MRWQVLAATDLGFNSGSRERSAVCLQLTIQALLSRQSVLRGHLCPMLNVVPTLDPLTWRSGDFSGKVRDRTGYLHEITRTEP